MKQHFSVIRAISAEFLSRKYKSAVLWFSVISVLIVVLSVWLTALHALWWILVVVIACNILAGILALCLVGAVLKVGRPKINASQHVMVRDFVDKLESVSGAAQTPVFIIVFRIVKDLLFPGRVSFIEKTANDSVSLRGDFIKLREAFGDN